ncbi:hypothetical protein BTA51_16200 [Hahella sp. CCB-MM4]|uniref:GNAT family N-acetyltransferase n=1 Tax=Hahella sp. (strain CCB-MM4) TaxID=1926491 RepID=UPI000B9BC4A0|nr:GNAT family N-acetyltransferase [Hahella sp. CCB-MM4]OZG72280.1 hypothetical protein BTA51_16200 [Hahella sp. CCB-MM4]
MVFDTERLVVRELTMGDTDFVIDILNDPDFIRNVVDRGVRTKEDAENYLLEGPLKSYRDHGYGLFAVELKPGQKIKQGQIETDNKVADKPIGLCGLIKRDFLAAPDIGFAFLPDFRGQGYAKEAAMGTLRLARDELHIPQVMAITSKENVDSMTLLIKLGMKMSGTVTYPGSGEELNLFIKDL